MFAAEPLDPVTSRSGELWRYASVEVSVEIRVGERMNNVYTAVVKRDGDWWIGWIEEVPGVNRQESSRTELLISLKMTLQEALEFNRQDAIAAAGGRYQEESIAV